MPSLWTEEERRKDDGTVADSCRVQPFAAFAQAFAPRHASLGQLPPSPPPLSSPLSSVCGGQPAAQRESTSPSPFSLPTSSPCSPPPWPKLTTTRSRAPLHVTSSLRSGFSSGETGSLGTPGRHAPTTSSSVTVLTTRTSTPFSAAFRPQRRHSPTQGAMYRRTWACPWIRRCRR